MVLPRRGAPCGAAPRCSSWCCPRCQMVQISQLRARLVAARRAPGAILAPAGLSGQSPWSVPGMPWLDDIGMSAPSEARGKVRKLRRPTGARRELHGSARRTQDSSQRRESATNPDSKRAGANEKISGGKNAIVSPRATKRAIQSAGNRSQNREESGLGISQLGLFPISPEVLIG